jgi:hypothetical protein
MVSFNDTNAADAVRLVKRMFKRALNQMFDWLH